MALAASPALAETIANPVAAFSGLDKITGRITNFDVYIDETVQFAKLRVARNDEGRLRLRRTYTFEFSDTGDNRRHGAIVMLGGELQDMQLEPYRVQ